MKYTHSGKRIFLYKLEVLAIAIMFIMTPFLMSPGLASAQQAGACANTNYGLVTGSFTVPTAGTYRVWSRLSASTANTANNSYSLEVDGNTCVPNVGDATISSSTYTWTDYKDGNTGSKIQLTLAAGRHTFRAVGREPGVKLDRVIFTSNLSCVPTGDGANCLPTPPPILLPDLIVSSISQVPATPKVGDAVRFSAVIKNQGSAAVPAGTIVDVAFKINGAWVSWSDTHANGLAAGASVTLTANGGPNNGDGNWRPTAAGSYTLVANANDINRVSNEATRDNNTLTQTVQVQPNDTTPPPAPTNLRTTNVAYNSVALAWNASTDAVDYVVRRNNVVVGTVTGLTYTDNTVSAGTAYSYTVLARDAAGNNSAASAALNVNTPQPADTTPPSKPTGLIASRTGTNQVNLSWTASTDNIGVAGYKIFRNGTQIGTTAALSFGDATIANNSQYLYTISAYDSAGNNSPASDPGPISTMTVSGIMHINLENESAVFRTGNATIQTDANASGGSYLMFGE